MDIVQNILYNAVILTGCGVLTGSVLKIVDAIERPAKRKR